MQHILSRLSCKVLQRLAGSQTMCAFDFDGTLAPIVEHPTDAAISERTRLLLTRLAALYPVVILSGRSRADLIPRLRGIAFARIIGNHGAETEHEDHNALSQIRRWKAAVELGIAPLPGLWLEDKGLSLAVHYRQTEKKAEARQLIDEVTRGLPRVRVIGGKQVVNLVIDGAPDKGNALISERERLDCKTVLYVGDDDNDEDAFAAEGDVVGVRVGRKRTSHAKYFLRSQDEIDRLLELLVLLRDPDEAVALCERQRQRKLAGHALASQ